ncbi:MAG: dUTPase [Bacillales bacterium]|jgi:dimeric dUTPase (all-alpha-NTP-PPase superfamily)|nr:dUTPase [Bacillales bacterium]
MDFTKLLSIQSELDRVIMEKHGFQKKEKTKEKVLAFLVELGELANETKCFKYWSIKPPAEREVILDEYADGLHFLLSISLDLGIKNLETTQHKCETNKTEQFLKVYCKANDFQKSHDFLKFMQLFTAYLNLGGCLGFSISEIEDAYYNKNRVNHQRQENGY